MLRSLRSNRSLPSKIKDSSNYDNFLQRSLRSTKEKRMILKTILIFYRKRKHTSSKAKFNASYSGGDGGS